MARVVFWGTPRFAVPVLQAVASTHDVVLVVTQPDRQGGRGCRQLYVPAIKQAAEHLGLPVLQTCSLRRESQSRASLVAAGADVWVLAAFGQVLRPDVLAVPAHGCIGVHASLLPRLRGAAPIPWAILRGEAQTGISLMVTDAGLDTGPLIAQQPVPVADEDTSETLGEKLAQVGATMILEVLPMWLAGRIEPQAQDGALATFAPPLSREHGLIDWRRSAVEIARQVRACVPWPGTGTTFLGMPLKVLAARALPFGPHEYRAGTVIECGDAVCVVTGGGLLLLDEVQLAGRRPLRVRDFARGQRAFVGSVLGA